MNITLPVTEMPHLSSLWEEHGTCDLPSGGVAHIGHMLGTAAVIIGIETDGQPTRWFGISPTDLITAVTDRIGNEPAATGIEQLHDVDKDTP